ncbi:MAG: hypothetical protein QHH14_03245 [Clostridiales bacterium]|nr:hypothetical protein [Clostridiales bacterium]
MMKKASTAILVVMTVAFLLGPYFLRADSRDDLQAIKKAVKENPAFEAAGKDVKWFKILVTDNKTGKDKAKVTMPIAIVEIFLRCADNKHLRMKESGCDIDIAAVFKELKAMGPMALIEVYEDDETVKIWLE